MDDWQVIEGKCLGVVAAAVIGWQTSELRIFGPPTRFGGSRVQVGLIIVTMGGGLINYSTTQAQSILLRAMRKPKTKDLIPGSISSRLAERSFDESVPSK